ncbi:ammonium transporter [soil metagenome]
MFRALRAALLPILAVFIVATPLWAQDAKPAEPVAAAVVPDPAKTPATVKDVTDAKNAALQSADIAWMLVSCALVMFMMPGLALFYGGMARRKNVLGTMMHTMVALGVVGVQWVVIGYSLSFGDSAYKIQVGTNDKGEPIMGSLIGYSPELVGLSVEAATATATPEQVKKEKPSLKDDEVEKEVARRNQFKTFPNTQLPLYLHAMFQGMFAIITVALISGAFAERVKFGSYLLFALLWTTLVYDPIAHWVWSFDWQKAAPTDAVNPAAGWLGVKGAIDFAGGTVVHIAAGISGLACVLLLRKRNGYGKQTFHPNSMVLTLLGGGMLWFGWFGFNGGSALFSNAQAVSAFTVTQVAAATAGLAWLLVEWLHRGKPTALGFASGLVAGLVAITPASGYVSPMGALAIGAIAGVACYWAVAAKTLLGYDDSLDAFGIHGVGGFIGAILTGVFVSLPLWLYGSGMPVETFPGKLTDAKVIDFSAQIQAQLIAACASAIYAFIVTTILVLLIDKTIGFTCKPKDEAAGLDLSMHGETGFDMGPDVDAGAVVEPKSAMAPPMGGQGKRFTVVVDGPAEDKLLAAWTKLCGATDKPPSKEFAAVYPFVTTISGNKFRFRGGDAVVLKDQLKKLFEDNLAGSAVKTHVES